MLLDVELRDDKANNIKKKILQNIGVWYNSLLKFIFIYFLFIYNIVIIMNIISKIVNWKKSVYLNKNMFHNNIIVVEFYSYIYNFKCEYDDVTNK